MTGESCVFCKIVSKELSAKVIYEDERCMAILDNNPINPGHTLIIPKEHYKTITDMPRELNEHLAGVAWNIVLKIEKELDPDGINILQNNNIQAGQVVPHYHKHVIPRFIGDEEQYKEWRTIKQTEKELEQMQKRLKIQN